MLTLEVIGTRVKAAREAKGLSQLQFVNEIEKAGLKLSRETLSKIETGSRSVSVLEIKAICKAISLDAEEFLKDDEEDNLVTLFRKHAALSNIEEILGEVSQIQNMLKDFIVQKDIYTKGVTAKKYEPLWKE